VHSIYSATKETTITGFYQKEKNESVNDLNSFLTLTNENHPLGEFDWQQGFDLRVLIPNLVVVEGGDLGRALQKQKSLQPRMK